jgi:hypothetical protein
VRTATAAEFGCIPVILQVSSSLWSHTSSFLPLKQGVRRTGAGILMTTERPGITLVFSPQIASN